MIEVEPLAPTSDAFSYFTVIWGLVKVLWPFLLIAIAIPVIPYLFERHRLRRLALSGIFEIDHMDGKTFEEFLGELFRRKGYAVELTPYRGDRGADLILIEYGIRTVVQAMRYKKPVGLRAVQEAVTARAKYCCTESMIVTNATFTRSGLKIKHYGKHSYLNSMPETALPVVFPQKAWSRLCSKSPLYPIGVDFETGSKQAVELARVNGVQLWNREKLISELFNNINNKIVSVS